MNTKNNVSRNYDAIVVNVTRSIAEGKDIKEAAGFCWKISDVDFLNKAHYVCAQTGGVIVAVYELKGWYKMDDFNVGSHYLNEPSWKGRVGFVLMEASAHIKQQYIGKSFGTIPTQPVKFIRSEQEHRYDQQFSPDYHFRFLAYQQELLNDELRTKFNKLDMEVNYPQCPSDPTEFDELIDELLTEPTVA